MIFRFDFEFWLRPQSIYQSAKIDQTTYTEIKTNSTRFYWTENFSLHNDDRTNQNLSFSEVKFK